MFSEMDIPYEWIPIKQGLRMVGGRRVVVFVDYLLNCLAEVGF